jgi:acetyl esterase/lipase
MPTAVASSVSSRHPIAVGSARVFVSMDRMWLTSLVIACSATVCLTGQPADDALVVPVWPAVPPGSEGKSGSETVRVTEAGDHVVSNVHRPSLTVYLPAAGRATGAGVLVIPGGRHRELWMDHEGHAVARWLRERGVAAFVLKYRLAREAGSTYSIVDHALPDTQRALRLIRSRGGEWRVTPDRVGVIGFSAGGELAALAATRYDDGVAGAADVVDRQSSRPAFQALIYPGRSGDIQPTKESPPAFLACGYNDRPDISEGLAGVYLSFKKVGVQTELHIFSGVGHGFGLRARNQGPVAGWPQRFLEWLGEREFLAKPQSP